MKVGIITFHFVPNQGAVLQCLATKTFLEKNGHEAFVIDYRPYYHVIRYCKHRNPVQYARWYWKKHRKKSLPGRVAVFGKSFVRALVLNRKKSENATLDAFEAFTSKYLPMTERYDSLKQLRERPPVMDAYVSGSDQLWNPQLLDQELDRAYFLDFGEEKVPKVSYAVSMGKLQEERYLKELKDCCKVLTAVSIREYDAETISATGRDVHVCIDPTLLLEPSDFEAFENKEVADRGEYVFIYGFEDTKELQEAVRAVREKYGLKVVNGSPHRITIEDAEKLRDYGPDQFLSLIKGAKFVVTNSFHGTAFSIIYQKNFITVPHSTRGSRMTDLLGKLGLAYRLWGTESFSYEREIDWNDAHQKLMVLRQHSADYLLVAIGGARGEEIPHWDEERKEN